MNVSKPPVIAISLAAIAPFLMGAEGQPNWLPWVISAGSTLGGYGLILGGRVVSAYLRSRAATLRADAEAKLADQDKTNDAQASSDLAKAAGMEAAADVLEHRPKQE